MSAPLKRKIALLEAKLATEIEAHKKTFGHYRDELHARVLIELRHKAAIAALHGDDYFEGGK